MTSYCSRCIQPLSAAMNQAHGHTDGFYRQRGRRQVSFLSNHGWMKCGDLT